MKHHKLDATCDTVHWGFFDGNLRPVLTIQSGDSVTIETVNGNPDVMPAFPLAAPENLTAIHRKVPKKLPGHICTGPIAVESAHIGQVLEVKIKKITLACDWAYTYAAPLLGLLPKEVGRREIIHIPLDKDKMSASLPWGQNLRLRPFFGVMAVAPSINWGMISTLPPRANGGNLDNKELVQGTTLYLPIHVDGANFSVGDGHAAQGDGEVCATAVETGLIGEFEFVVRDDLCLEWPIAETPDHLITMGFDADLRECSRIALSGMISELVKRNGVSRPQAYMLCSMAADLRITQIVNGNNGVHCMLPKEYLKS